MATKYVVYKRYEKRVGVGKFPEIKKMYLSESLPHIELTGIMTKRLDLRRMKPKG